jgi:hypothetical protein
VPGTAVFGTRGGLTGVISPKLDRKTVANSLRARHTFATTGQRLVGLSWLVGHDDVQQGDEVDLSRTVGQVKVGYRFLGQTAGWERIDAHVNGELLVSRDLLTEIGRSVSHVRVSWCVSMLMI